jgi:hypothetical protein
MIVTACAVFFRYGLNWTSGAISVVEVFVSLVAAALGCSLIGLPLIKLVTAARHGLLLAGICAIGAAIGKLAATALSAQGALALMIILFPPAIAYCWFEAATVFAMVARSFGSASATPAGLSVERE